MLVVRGDGKYLFGTEVLTEEQAKEIDELLWCQLFRFERRPIGHFYTRIAGVSYRNSDNTSRQRIIRELNPGERLELWIEPDNKHDKNAVSIKRLNGEQVGFVNAQLAPTIVLLNKHDVRFGPFVISVREAVEDAPLGVLLAIVYTWGDQPMDTEGRYIRGVVEPELQDADFDQIEHYDREANNLP